jgi:hypothetical protein
LPVSDDSSKAARAGTQPPTCDPTEALGQPVGLLAGAADAVDGIGASHVLIT